MRFLLLIAVVSLGMPDAQAPSSDAGNEAIRDLVAQYMAARNAKDADATRRLFTNDADQLVSSGEWRRGLDKLIQGAMASSQKETGHSSIEIETIRMVKPDIAIVDGRYKTTSASGVREMWTTLVVMHTDAGWRITAIRNMLPAPVSNHP